MGLTMTTDDGFPGISEEDFVQEEQLDEERLAEAWLEYEEWLKSLDQLDE